MAARVDRRLQLSGGSPRAARRRGRCRPGGEPDRAAPVLPEPRGARVRRGPRHRHRGVVADRPGRCARRSGRDRDRREGRQDRRRRSCCGGISSARASSSRSRSRRRGSARTSSCSTSSSTRTTRRPSTVSIVVSPAGAARIPTRWRGSLPPDDDGAARRAGRGDRRQLARDRRGRAARRPARVRAGRRSVLHAARRARGHVALAGDRRGWAHRSAT